MKIEELIKERDLVKEALQAIAKIDAEKAELAANEYVNMKFLEKHAESKDEANNPTVSLHTDEQGTKWIRIKAMGEDFSLSLFDMRDGDKKDFTWEEAMKFAESHGQELPSKNQWMLVDMLRKDIDKLIEDNGGDPLEKWYWSKTVAQFNSTYAWLYYGYHGTLYDYNECNSIGGRSLVYHH